MKKPTKINWLGWGLVLAGVALIAFLVFRYLVPALTPPPVTPDTEPVKEATDPPDTTQPEETTAVDTETEPGPESTEETTEAPPETTAAEYTGTYQPQSGDPFTDAVARNPDVYAWIQIPGTAVSFPVLQRADDSFYLNHNARGYYDPYGCVYSESAYNNKDMEDPVTVFYGHCIPPAAFSSLQTIYSSSAALDQYGTIIVSTSDVSYTYQIYAAVPYDSRHIMYRYGSGSPESRDRFLKSITDVRRIDAFRREDRFPDDNDKILVLSTCLRGNDQKKRFIVVAKRLDP